MKKFLLPLLITLAFIGGACSSTSYKVAPSTLQINERASAVNSHVITAEEAVKTARTRGDSAIVKTKASQASTKTVGEHINAALTNLGDKDYTSAAQHLIAAKVDNAVVASYLEQTLEDMLEQGKSLGTAQASLISAKAQIVSLKGVTKELQSKIDKATTDGADDHVIAVRCKSFFGLGAIFYGVERLLKAGIVGFLIFGAVVLVLVVGGTLVGGTVGPLALKAGTGLFRGAVGLVKRKSTTESS